jgi:hypothetical protein
MFEKPSGIAAKLRYVQDAVPKISDLFEQKDAKIRAINRRDLTTVAVGAKIAEISAIFDSQIEALLKSVGEYADAGTAIGDAYYSRQACFMRAVADAAPSTTQSILTRLRRESASQLLDEAALAAGRGDEVLGGCILIEIVGRTEGPGDGPGSAPRLSRGQRQGINDLLATIPTDSEKVQPMLVELDILRREASIRAGKGTPTSKIALALLKNEAAGNNHPIGWDS